MFSADENAEFERLLGLAPPPKRVPAHPPEEWARVEAATGPLPPDYVSFIDRYGFVRLDDFLMVYSPFAPSGPGNLIDQLEIDLDAYRTIRSGNEAEMPLPARPEPGGLFPVGRTDNGDVLFWRTGGDNWPIVIFGEGDRRHTQFDATLVGLLADVIAGDVVVDVFPNSFPTTPPAFVPVP